MTYFHRFSYWANKKSKLASSMVLRKYLISLDTNKSIFCISNWIIANFFSSASVCFFLVEKKNPLIISFRHSTDLTNYLSLIVSRRSFRFFLFSSSISFCRFCFCSTLGKASFRASSITSGSLMADSVIGVVLLLAAVCLLKRASGGGWSLSSTVLIGLSCTFRFLRFLPCFLETSRQKEKCKELFQVCI